MNDINWKDASSFSFDPNIVYKVKLAYDRPTDPFKTKYGMKVTWGVFYGGEPFKIWGSPDGTLISLLKQGRFSAKDEVEIIKHVKGDETEWSVNGKMLEDLSKKKQSTEEKSDSDTKKMIQDIEKMKSYLTKVQAKLLNQEEAIKQLREVKKKVDDPNDDGELPF